MQIKELMESITENGYYINCENFSFSNNEVFSKDYSFIMHPDLFYDIIRNKSELFLLDKDNDSFIIHNVKLKKNSKVYDQITLHYVFPRIPALHFMQFVTLDISNYLFESINIKRYYSDIHDFGNPKSPEIKFCHKINKLLLSLEKSILQEGFHRCLTLR